MRTIDNPQKFRSKIIENLYKEVKEFTTVMTRNIEKSIYNYSLDKEKYLRRINRFKNILENSKEEIIFIRKGHAYHHHQESNNIKNDIEDATNLDNILQEKYKNLSYKIIVIIVCGTCFDINNNYLSNNKRIKIYNISTPSVDDKKFEQKFNELFVLKV